MSHSFPPRRTSDPDPRSTSPDRTKRRREMGGDPPLPRKGQMDEAGFLARVGITGDRKSHMGLRPFEGGLRHGDRHGPGYRALLLDQVERAADPLRLRLVGIGPEAPLEDMGAALAVGKQPPGHTAAAHFRGSRTSLHS